MDKGFKSGFIGIAGLANAGKSTLINSLVGEKVAIVSWRPQTTRNKILGIANGENYQLVLVDTPGIHKVKNNLGKYMMQAVEQTVKGVDAVLYVIDASKGLQKEDYEFIETNSKKLPIIVALNKEECVTKDTLFQSLDKLNKVEGIEAVIPISAKKQDNLDTLRDEILKVIPYGEKMYPDDMYTECSMNFMTTEIIREKAMYLLDKEIPYGIGVYINKFQEREDQPICDIDADIICERQSHKAIIIGKNGEMLKKIASQAREDIEKMVGCKVFLTLYVKVKTEWRDNDLVLKELGYDIKELRKE